MYFYLPVSAKYNSAIVINKGNITEKLFYVIFFLGRINPFLENMLYVLKNLNYLVNVCGQIKENSCLLRLFQLYCTFVYGKFDF